MIAKKDFNLLRKKLEHFDSERESLIKKSRDVVKLSKQIIYSIHRRDLKKAEDFVKKIRKEAMTLNRFVKNYPALISSGAYKVAMQEFVEALAYFEFVKNRKLLSYSGLKIEPEHYLLGICDLTGELVRNAVNSATKNEFEQAVFIKSFVSELYDELLRFDFKNELRKKSDSIKYDLKKLEDLVLELKLRGKI